MLPIVLFLVVCSPVDADLLSDVQDTLTASAFDGYLRLRLSGALDLETYAIDRPAPGLIYTTGNFLFNPRLSVYLDAQLGSHVYSFVQARFDRGFDPSNDGAQVRLDEYAIRITPWNKLKLGLQAGKFATVVGNWVPRHYSWDNPFINAPLPYENLTGLWAVVAPDSVETLFYWGHVPFDNVRQFGNGYTNKSRRLPVIWGPNYTSGFAIIGSIERFDYAFELKNAALASRPGYWDLASVGLTHPTFSGRIAFRPNLMWNLGFSGSVGSYLESEAGHSLPPGKDIGDYHEVLLGQDISFAWHHFQLWAEVFETRFEVANVGNADLLSYYIEAKYKVTAQLFVAGRWNQQLYGDVPYNGSETRWGNDAWRIDAAIGYRFTPYLQLKLQGSFTHHDQDVPEGERLLAAQLTLRF